MKWLYRSLNDGKLCKTPEDIDAAKAKGYRTLDEVMADASRNRLKKPAAAAPPAPGDEESDAEPGDTDPSAEPVEEEKAEAPAPPPAKGKGKKKKDAAE